MKQKVGLIIDSISVSKQTKDLIELRVKRMKELLS